MRLRRKEKSFEENLKFAIKAWQSVEFTLSTKYEVVLQWISEHMELNVEDLLEEDMKELLKLRAQPGLVRKDVKTAFISWCLRMASSYDHKTRKWCELLTLMLEFEPLQDLFRMDYKLHAQVFEAIFYGYERYLENRRVDGKEFLNTHETEFVASILNTLKDTIKRCGDVKLFETAFTSTILNALVNVLLTMRTAKVDFIQELTEIEGLLYIEMKDSQLIDRIMKMPLHVRLLALECSILNRRCVDEYIKCLINTIFYAFVTNQTIANDTSLNMTMAAYVLEMFCRHDVNLNLYITKNQTALQFLGEHIFEVVKNFKGDHLKEVLMILCAALRLNPLILENNVFKITVSVILEKKSGDLEEKHLFEEYLVLLMDMFRRLSRAEKFVSYLLKTLNECLEKDNVFSTNKRKCIDKAEDMPAKKKKKGKSAKTESNVVICPKYLNIQFEDFFKPVLTQKKSVENTDLSASASFVTLQNYWPSNPVGIAFSRIITGLVSKPSLIIWKKLLFALKELLESFQDTKTLNEQQLFQLDFHVALLSQYFAGCKLAEKSEHFIEDLNSQREFTRDVLQSFGKFILEREHQTRTMAAFLEVSFFATSLELIIAFYRPDGCVHDSLQPSNILCKLHGFLSLEEWILIQQRVLNFGQSTCKFLLQRLQHQKTQSSLLLLGSVQDKLQIERSIATSDGEQIHTLLKCNNGQWLISQLSRSAKASIAAHFTTSNNLKDLLPLIRQDSALLEFVSLDIYEHICSSFSSKNNLLKSISCYFDEMRQCVDTSVCETLIKRLIDIIKDRAEEEYKVKNIDVDEIKTRLELLSQLPVGHLRRQRKTIIFAIHLCLYRDLKCGKEDELAVQALEIMKGV